MRLREIERMLHVIGDFAMAVSTFEVRQPSRPAAPRGVNCLRLRKVSGQWRIENVLCSGTDGFLTIRRSLAQPSVDRPPPAVA